MFNLNGINAYHDNAGQPITPVRMRQLGSRISEHATAELRAMHIDESVLVLALASVTIGEAKRLGMTLPQLFQLIQSIADAGSSGGG